MLCPKCKHDETRVVDSREVDESRATRRRRECESCAHRFTTYERIELGNLIVRKRDGTPEPYDRAKLERGIWRALEKRPVNAAQVAAMVDDIENAWREDGLTEIKSDAIGDAVLTRLKDLDDVAYIRFASVYKAFQTAGEFQAELKKLSKEK